MPSLEATIPIYPTWPRWTRSSTEFAGHEGNYATGNTLRSAHLKESEVAEQTGGVEDIAD